MDKVVDYTYLINLDSRKDRLEHASQELKSNGITTFKRYPAIIGKELTESFLQSITTKEVISNLDNTYREKHSQLTRGGIGCALSHINIWKTLANSNNEYALIFEDDIIINKTVIQNLISKIIPTIQNKNVYSTLDIFLKTMKNIELDWDILLLQPMKPYGLDLVEYQSIPILTIETDKKYSLVKQNVFWGLGGYFITRKCARRLLKDIYPIKNQIDTHLSLKSLEKQINIYAITPNIVNQNIFLGTNIQNMCPSCDINIEIRPHVSKTDIIVKKPSMYLNTLVIILILLCILIVYRFRK